MKSVTQGGRMHGALAHIDTFVVVVGKCDIRVLIRVGICVQIANCKSHVGQIDTIIIICLHLCAFSQRLIE